MHDSETYLLLKKHFCKLTPEFTATSRSTEFTFVYMTYIMLNKLRHDWLELLAEVTV